MPASLGGLGHIVKLILTDVRTAHVLKKSTALTCQPIRLQSLGPSINADLAPRGCWVKEIVAMVSIPYSLIVFFVVALLLCCFVVVVVCLLPFAFVFLSFSVLFSFPTFYLCSLGE